MRRTVSVEAQQTQAKRSICNVIPTSYNENADEMVMYSCQASARTANILPDVMNGPWNTQTQYYLKIECRAMFSFFSRRFSAFTSIASVVSHAIVVENVTFCVRNMPSRRTEAEQRNAPN